MFLPLLVWLPQWWVVRDRLAGVDAVGFEEVVVPEFLLIFTSVDLGTSSVEAEDIQLHHRGCNIMEVGGTKDADHSIGEQGESFVCPDSVGGDSRIHLTLITED